MSWPEWHVAVEFDGAQHWTDSAQRTRDIDRWAQLEALGWHIVRVSGDMLRYRPGVVVERPSERYARLDGPVRSALMHAFGRATCHKSDFGGQSSAGNPNFANRPVSKNATT
jgi:Protein of unknown function (DUF559)